MRASYEACSMISYCRLYLNVGVLLSVCMFSHVSRSQATLSYWDTPVPYQMPVPSAPETCGACHSDKYSDWSTSQHAHAFSSGLLGQIIDYDEVDAANCLNCHAPLAEQQASLLESNLEELSSDMAAYDSELLARHGVFCAACHLRDGIMHAPSITTPDNGTRVHQQVKVEPLMRDSQFCSSCHQFDATETVNGKPLQNTYREWLESPYAEQGKTCQHCHMPKKAHLFRGIHDPDMVRQGLTISTQFNQVSAELIIRSTGVGHRFPTYSVPRVRLSGTLLGPNSDPLSGGYHEKIIQRDITIDDNRWIELSDTRLEPGESARLNVPWSQGSYCASAIAFRIIIEPEWFYYEKVYPIVLEELEVGPARDLIKQAKSLAENRNYALFEQTISNTCTD